MFVKVKEGYINLNKVKSVKFMWDEDCNQGEVLFMFDVISDNGRIAKDNHPIIFNNKASYEEYVNYIVDCINNDSIYRREN